MTVDREALFADLQGRMRAFVARRVDDPHQAEDLAQEIVLRIHRRLDDVRDEQRLDAFAYQVARNAIADHYRGRAGRREFPAGERLPELAASEEPLDAAELARQEIAACLLPMVQQLPEPYREAITLTDVGGLSQAEAARRLGISVPGMKARVQRGRRKLRVLFDDCCRLAYDADGRLEGYEPRRDCRPSDPNRTDDD